MTAVGIARENVCGAERAAHLRIHKCDGFLREGDTRQPGGLARVSIGSGPTNWRTLGRLTRGPANLPTGPAFGGLVANVDTARFAKLRGLLGAGG